MKTKIIILLLVCLANVAPLIAQDIVFPQDESGSNLQIDRLNKFSKNFGSLIISSHKKENLIYSPLSAYYVLCLIAYGTASNTAKQLLTALGLPKLENKQGTLVAHDEISRSLTKYEHEKDIVIKIANAVFVGKNLKLSPYFSNFAKRTFHAETKSTHGTNLKLHDVANRWIDQVTNHKIRTIVKESDVDDSSLILINAIYFNAKWFNLFVSDGLKKNFYDLNNNAKKLEMMSLETSLNSGSISNLGVKFVVLPYENKDYKMVIVWPTNYINDKRFTKLGTQLSSYGYKNIINSAIDSYMSFVMPPFKVESEFNLEPILREMNVNELFDNGDFKSSLLHLNEPVKVKIIQKAFITVGNEGTEAAAATSGGITLYSAFEPDMWVVDRPFYYAIVSSQGTLFEGCVVNPQN